jgi:hypothetical protein
MRAQTVNFERGQEPYDALNIGKKYKIRKAINDVYNLSVKHDWGNEALPVPNKKDIEQWVDWYTNYLEDDESLDELLDDLLDEGLEYLFIGFLEYWTEKND